MTEHSQSSSQFYHTLQRPDPRAASLTAPGFAWLLPEAWDEALLAYFIAAQQQAPNQAAALPAYIRRSKHPCPQLIAHWVLTNRQRQARGWAAAQLFPQALRTVHCYVGLLEDEEGLGASDALSFLISALFLNHKTDILKLTTSCPRARAILQGIAAEAGQWHDVLTPPRGFGLGWATAEPLHRLGQLVITPEAWWAHPLGSRERVTLNYLALRQKKAEAEDMPCHLRPRRQSFWQRFFGGGSRRPRAKK